jgi:hypothetical protein
VSDFREQFKTQLAALSDRDRRVLRLGALVSITILLVGSMTTVVGESQATVNRVEKKRLQLADLPAARDRSERLQRMGSDAALSLEMLVKRITDKHGLSTSVEIQPDSSVRLRAEDASFDAVIECLGDFEATSISVRSASLTSAGSGRVDLNLELYKSTP